ncbi:MAG: preprotein translocase subunit SecA [Pirellulaceae bacterium]
MIIAGDLTWLSAVHRYADSYKQLPDRDLRPLCLELGGELREHQDFKMTLPKVAALVQTASARTLGISHYDVQLVGGKHLALGSIVEMRTGEGKTLTAVIPLVVHALFRKGALLATANDYLARRDAEWNFPICQLLGLSVGTIQTEMDRSARRDAYTKDITYGTMKEFGFDFLRDYLFKRETKRGEADWLGVSQNTQADKAPVQREPYFLLVDEADSILIDDARTPLILSGATDAEAQQRQANIFNWCAAAASQFVEDEHYLYDKEKRKVELTTEGTQLVRKIAKPPELLGVGLLELYDSIERAVQVARDYLRDRDYVVREEEVMIVDESTGRISHGRRWSRGIHQAIEAKEGLKPTAEAKTQAKVTVQAFVNRFPVIAGMTGTAASSAAEFRKVYRVRVHVLPTHRPIQQISMPTIVTATETEKWEAIVREIQQINNLGRPILVGTRSIAKSEQLSSLLQREEIVHRVLNANHIEREAEIIASAGQRGRVTVATNMAGRGTDIQIDDEVRSLGGLHVIGTELHESVRVDRQLFGRCARQGDPGSIRQFICHEDNLLEGAFGMAKATTYRKNYKNRSEEWWVKLFKSAQHKLERRHFRARKILMYNEKQINRNQREMGFDPILDHIE